MAVEIERKFLLRDDSWRGLGPGVSYRQGYLSREPERTVRVRTASQQAWLTIKGLSDGPSRLEFEYEIPVDDAQALLALCEQPLIEKTRYGITVGDDYWEIDEFTGANAGLVVAECELATAAQVLVLPPWIGTEVTGDRRYFNSSLVKCPYSSW